MEKVIIAMTIKIVINLQLRILIPNTKLMMPTTGMIDFCKTSSKILIQILCKTNFVSMSMIIITTTTPRWIEETQTELMSSSKIVTIWMESLISKVHMKDSILSIILLRRKSISLTFSKTDTARNGIVREVVNKISILIILLWVLTA